MSETERTARRNGSANIIMNRVLILAAAWFLTALHPAEAEAEAAQLQAGAARVEITDRAAGPVHDPSYVKALVLTDGDTTAVLVTVDAVAIGGIGRIGDGYLASVRAQLHKELGVRPEQVLVNASHCHSVVRGDADVLTVTAVKEAWRRRTPVTVGAGVGREDRIMENRRLRIKDGSEVDVRRAYSMPRDEDVVAIGPIDPQIGLLRVDRLDGTPLAVVYNVACHPIQGVPDGGNTADFPGFASRAIEENLGHEALALFVQGCAGDVNPANYKGVHTPHDAEPLGTRLGLSVLRAWRTITPRATGPLRVVHESIAIPRATDMERRIAAMRAEQTRLVQSLQGTSLNLETFLPLLVQYRTRGAFPSADSHRYAHEKALGRDDLRKLDAANRADLDAYLANIDVMERLTRLQTNLALLQKHLAENQAAGGAPIDAELVGLRVGDFRLITFPGELTVEIGLGIKARATGPPAFVAGYTNGYLFYLPTERQRKNPGHAQEDCDCLVAPEWQKLFEQRADALLKSLATP